MILTRHALIPPSIERLPPAQTSCSQREKAPKSKIVTSWYNVPDVIRRLPSIPGLVPKEGARRVYGERSIQKSLMSSQSFSLRLLGITAAETTFTPTASILST